MDRSVFINASYTNSLRQHLYNDIRMTLFVGKKGEHKPFLPVTQQLLPYGYGDNSYIGLLEGVADNSERFDVNLHITNNNTIIRSVINDGCIYILSNIDFTKKYYIRYKNKIEYLDLYAPMRAGYISGNALISECGTSNFFIKCIRSDGFYIGEYALDVNGDYEIPNLNCYKQYDIILVDATSNIEAQILTKRVPVPYNEPVEKPIYFSAPYNLYAFSSSNGITLKWDSSGVHDSQTIYRSTQPFSKLELPTPLIMGVNGNSYVDSTASSGTTYYYRISTIRFGIERVSYQISTIDPYSNNIVSLLHFNNDITDQKGIVWNNNGANILSDGIDTSNGFISTPSATWNNFAYGQGDFTIECFMMQTATNNTSAIFSHAFNNTPFPIAVAFGQINTANFSNQMYIGFFNGSAWEGAQTSWSPTTGQTHHIAATREGSTYRLFADGNLIGTFNSTTSVSSTLEFRVGHRWDAPYGTAKFQGVIKEFRVTKGVSRYNSNFISPISTVL